MSWRSADFYSASEAVCNRMQLYAVRAPLHQLVRISLTLLGCDFSELSNGSS